ncbi:unnamed protein product [Arabis nemorensis]|uniref:Serine-threonine/tyrosine-protein kinase catalytic domain-containing protein n=1 Tax=Arabis nemorensis TaxID=586526 RepID=A0A565BU04_9BRAS|nr:unnamed protein product [Arabis nemorensis]
MRSVIKARKGNDSSKKLSSKSKQGNREFVVEIGMIFALQHPNLVQLYGCCIEGKEHLLVYDYLRTAVSLATLWFRETKLSLGLANKEQDMRRDCERISLST